MLQSRVSKIREGEGWRDRALVIIASEISYATTEEAPRRERREVDFPVPQARSGGEIQYT